MTTPDIIQRDVAILDLVREHLVGKHNSVEEFRSECLACDHYRLTFERDREREFVALTMIPEAAMSFLSALTYAASHISDDAHGKDAEMSHEQWLLWGATQLGTAIRNHHTSELPETGGDQ